MKVISFCLYGNKPIYTIGCIRNLELLKKVFVGWEAWVYHNTSVNQETLKQLQELGAKTILVDEDKGFENSLWRFKPIEDSQVDFFISRDTDSRLSERDEVAVNEWIESGKTFHVVRDHPVGHSWGINAGIFGAKGGSIPNFFELLENYLVWYKSTPHLVYDRYIDQCFLRDIIHPRIVGDMFLHDEYFNVNFNGEGQGHKIKRDLLLDKFAFVGESIDENDIPIQGQRIEVIKRYFQNK